MAATAPAAALLLLLPLLPAAPGAAATGVFQVRRKFPAGGGGGGTGAGGNISDLRAHDGARHGRLLGAVDLPLGGLGLPTDTGCGARQGGDLGTSNQALDGILGFGQSNTSMLSQLASAGKAKKVFSHCLDTINGGGIFAIGDLVQPKVKTTPLVPDMPHYNVNLKSIDVDGTILQLPSHVFETGEKKGTIIDSGIQEASGYSPP